MEAALVLLGLCLLFPSIAGCRNGMRVAHGAVEVEGICRTLKAMKRPAGGGEFRSPPVVEKLVIVHRVCTEPTPSIASSAANPAKNDKLLARAPAQR